jgi:MFS family permease
VAAANLAGKLADVDKTSLTTAAAGVLLTLSFVVLGFGKTSVAAIIVGIVVLDIGTQGMQITNQAVIYALRPDARSRINSAYMFCYFMGGAIGSVTAGIVFSADKWTGVCLLGVGFGVGTLAMTLFDRIRPPGRARIPVPERVGTAEPSRPG